LERAGTSLVNVLHSAGWFGTGAKVGVVMDNRLGSADEDFVNNVWKPELARYGIQIASEFTFNSAASTTTASAVATVSTEGQSLVLQFRGAGVNHVLFVPQTGDVFIVLAGVAASQQWYPQWELTTPDFPRITVGDPQKELALMTVFGWSPPQDNNAYDGLPNDAAVSQCEAIYPRSEWTSMPFPPEAWCDALFLVQRALSHGHGFSVAQLQSGVQNLGSSFQSAAGFGPTLFGQGRYDGAVEGRLARYDPSVKMYEYYGSPYQIP
jgi:hypothetical protein